MTGSEILDGIRAAKEERLRQGLRSGPVYGEAPLVWHDQVFGREETPAGTISCRQALRVGTQNALDVIVVASHKNGNKPLVVARGASLTLTLLQADAVDGKFEEVGPTVCVTAAEATNIEAGLPCGPLCHRQHDKALGKGEAGCFRRYRRPDRRGPLGYVAR